MKPVEMFKLPQALEIARAGHEASPATRRKWARAFNARLGEIRAASVSGRMLS